MVSALRQPSYMRLHSAIDEICGNNQSSLRNNISSARKETFLSVHLSANKTSPRPHSKSAASSMTKLDSLEEFLRTGGNTLLIKGEAGTGKTTLALQLLKGLSGDGNGVYISARVSERKLHRHSPGSVDLK